MKSGDINPPASSSLWTRSSPMASELDIRTSVCPASLKSTVCSMSAASSGSACSRTLARRSRFMAWKTAPASMELSIPRAAARARLSSSSSASGSCDSGSSAKTAAKSAERSGVNAVRASSVLPASRSSATRPTSSPSWLTSRMTLASGEFMAECREWRAIVKS